MKHADFFIWIMMHAPICIRKKHAHIYIGL